MKKKFLKRFISLLLCISVCFTLFPEKNLQNVYAREKYWIKVNKYANVATVYRKEEGRWVPVRAMLTSCGGYLTPSGNFHIQGKYRWKTLIENVMGQYCTRIVGSILFHSVWYYPGGGYHRQNSREFNKLGRTASHGCVRLSVMDAKWIYENCGGGTRVTIYSSSNPGPLGKPKAIKVRGSIGWDPTDPHPGNPRFRMRKPEFSFKGKPKILKYGTTHHLKDNVSVKNTNANEDISTSLRVLKKEIFKKGRYIATGFSTKKPGTYRITYGVNHPYSGANQAVWKIRVYNKYYFSRPVIIAKNRKALVGEKDVLKNVVATVGKDKKSVTNKIYGLITTPTGEVLPVKGYKMLKKYVFEEVGVYKIRLSVKNPYGKKRKIVHFIVKVEEEVSPDKEQTEGLSEESSKQRKKITGQ